MRCRLIGNLGFAFALTALAGSLSHAALPPPSVSQQQDRAVRVYCAEWRKTRGKLGAGEMNKRVITRLEKRYPTVFPNCQPTDHSTCMGWLNALVEGLRHYGQRSLTSVCSNFEAEDRERLQPLK